MDEGAFQRRLARRPVKISVVVRDDAPHQVEMASAMMAGFKRHGISVQRICPRSSGDDIVCVWGWRTARKWLDRPVLVMELGYVGDRIKAWRSLGWNGLNGRARFPTGDGSRWQRYFADVMRPWSYRDGYALLIGQIPGDASVDSININRWLTNTRRALEERGYEVRLRPHPLVRSPKRSLADDLAKASVCVTYNSNTGVDAVLSGVPAVTMDEGAMAWPVTAHSLDDDFIRPDRTEWAHNLAWCQWTMDEIASGEAWEHVRAAL